MSKTKCEHKTAITERPANGQRNYRVSLCTWGCGEVLVSVERLDGLTDTWTVSELLEVMNRSSEHPRMELVTLTDDECRRLSQEPGTQAYIQPSTRLGFQNGYDVYVLGRYVGSIEREAHDAL